MIRDQASQRQVTAADPRASTWLSANAGSGKTRVLTDRVARLLLDGVEPQNILCLTYTKAAAAEMQNRLFKRLGQWAMMEDGKLRDDLALLGDDQDIDDTKLAIARRLFASAIETPGGLKIQTIHSFCSGVLRRFPLEAAVSPQFKEMDDRTAQLLRTEVLDQIVTGDRAGVIRQVLNHFTGSELDELARDVASKQEAFDPATTDTDLRIALNVAPNLTPSALVDHVFEPDAIDALRKWQVILAKGSSTEVAAAKAIAKIDLSSPQFNDIGILEGFMIFGEKAASPFGPKTDKFPTKPTREKNPELTEDLNHIMQAVADVRQDRMALNTVARTRALYDFAQLFLPAYALRKQQRGLLDFDDLIRKTKNLLTDRVVAQWVLFRLDGGIDHVLVDEAQDTSPNQWAVVRQLTQEFTAGQGARTDRARTIFVVGDQKQSIYSFQGAAPEAFDEMRAHFRDALAGAQIQLQEDTDLEHSFRSSFAILAAVDQTFPDGAMMGTNKTSHHIAFKEEMPGRVDLWPVIEKEPEAETTDWFAPVDAPAKNDEIVRLADQIADQIKHMIGHETLPEEIGNTGTYNHRPITAGDFLILVRGRKSGLFGEIIRACKAAKLEIAGADRLRVGAELAVRDIVALLSFVALPEDDLSLACALRSPLFGWSEQDLFTLAQPRPQNGYLWSTLRDSAHDTTLATLKDLRKQADFLRPFDLIERILTRHGGRQKLLARLGGEAEDGIDALLSQALNYESLGVPSLTGFLAWVAADDLEIKRQMDSQGGKIRVMTVHGAKGLESPIVILPDMAKKQEKVRDALYPAGDHLIWPPTKPEMSDAVLALRDDILEADQKETNRLLYVAMTRAEKWLIVAAAGDVGEGGESWYGQVATAIEHVGAADDTSGKLNIQRSAHMDWQPGIQSDPLAPLPPPIPAPQFGDLDHPKRTTVITPSTLKGDKVMIGDHVVMSEEQAMARGTAIHLLLEHLPSIPSTDRAKTGRALLESLDEGLNDHAEITAHVMALLADPTLADLWNTDHLREVDISAAINDQRFHGTIDLLIVTDTDVRAIDYKSNRVVPDAANQTPDGILAQMAAYDAGLRQVFPDHHVEVAILWTQNAKLMVLPDDLISAHRSHVTLP